ncbi:MAG: Na/Pi cotransporter family protein [Eubacteriales bacterium]|nr:Na/Pi cotransporter family protein [Eubacteriales bacterium]
MDIELIGNLFIFVGGIGMFLYGMNIMADGMQKTAGGKMKQLIGYLTRNRFLAVVVGALITAIIQSSGATTVMVVGFVNAGLMTLVQAVGVIMGANIGTTITAWIVSLGQLGDAVKVLAPSFYAPLLMGLGAVIYLFSKKPKKKMVGEILVGIGLLFLGLDFMSSSISPYTDAPIFSKAFEVVGNNPLLGILIGIVVTAILQSSSASVGILQTLAINGVVTTNAAVFITLGQNIGSCVTALISSAGASRNAKRAACMHLIFNMAGAVLFGTLAFVIFMINPQLAAHNITSVEISIFHTFFNITCTIVMIPFANLLVKISGIVIREKSVDNENAELEAKDSYAAELARHFDDRLFEQPSFAVENALNEVIIMGNLSLDNIKYSSEAITNNDQNMIDKVYEIEHKVDLYEKYLTEYLIKINNLSITEVQHRVVNDLFHAIIDIERVSDHCENMAELAAYKIENDITFSEHGNEELKQLYDKVIKCFDKAIEARKNTSEEAARAVCRIEDEVDDFEEELRNKHIERLSAGSCKPSNGVVFLDILSNLERMSDHANNIADCILGEIDATK